jgi:hypothetical protein
MLRPSRDAQELQRRSEFDRWNWPCGSTTPLPRNQTAAAAKRPSRRLRLPSVRPVHGPHGHGPVGLIRSVPGAGTLSGHGKTIRSCFRAVPYWASCEIAPRFSRRREDGRTPPKRGTMKLKNHDWTDGEQRLKAIDTPLLQQDRTVRAALLTLAVFGVAALIGIVGYLVWTYCISGL